MTTQQAEILIVDDGRGIRDLLSFMLRTEGYHVTETTNGQDALARIETETFDVVITDVMMPGMNGLELLRRIREHDNDVVVIVMTAYASLQTAVEAITFGAYDYLIKPFTDVEKVMNVVGRAVERSRLTRRNARLLKDLQAANRRLQQMFAEAQERTAELETVCNELRELDRLKSEFVANISHEFRMPLALVKGYIALMAEHFLGGLNETQAKALQVVGERTDRLIQIVEDLLLMQDIESSNAYLCLEAVSLSNIVQRVCRRMLPRAQRKAITLSAPAKGNGSRALPVIQGDPMRLEQVITHLLDNAIKFSPPGSYVSVELDADNEYLRLSISDEGKGIALEKLAHVFDRFYQGSSGNRKEAAGIGLGLSLVRTIAEMHGGEVSVNSDPDVGTMVCLILPIEDKGRLLHQSMALNSSLAQQFHALIGSLATSQPAG